PPPPAGRRTRPGAGRAPTAAASARVSQPAPTERGRRPQVGAPGSTAGGAVLLLRNSGSLPRGWTRTVLRGRIPSDERRTDCRDHVHHVVVRVLLPAEEADAARGDRLRRGRHRGRRAGR